ncbi:hypothetical protein EMIT079MI2_100188 [Bacillus sp. IT-79MI2]
MFTVRDYTYIFIVEFKRNGSYYPTIFLNYLTYKHYWFYFLKQEMNNYRKNYYKEGCS